MRNRRGRGAGILGSATGPVLARRPFCANLRKATPGPRKRQLGAWHLSPSMSQVATIATEYKLTNRPPEVRRQGFRTAGPSPSVRVSIERAKAVPVSCANEPADGTEAPPANLRCSRPPLTIRRGKCPRICAGPTELTGAHGCRTCAAWRRGHDESRHLTPSPCSRPTGTVAGGASVSRAGAMWNRQGVLSVRLRQRAIPTPRCGRHFAWDEAARRRFGRAGLHGAAKTHGPTR